MSRVVNQGWVRTPELTDPEPSDDPDDPDDDDPTETDPDPLPSFDGETDVTKVDTWHDMNGDGELSVGDEVSYEIGILNSGPGVASGVSFVDTLDAGLGLIGEVSTSQGTVVSTSPIRVDVGRLASGERATISFRIEVTESIDRVVNQGWVRTPELTDPEPSDDPDDPDEDDPTELDIDDYAFSPQIEVSPSAIDVTDSVQVRVMSPVVVSSWAIWIYYPDGHIDKEFADSFSKNTDLPPGEWITIPRHFRPERLQSDLPEDHLIFEIRAREEHGVLGSGQDDLLVRSSNYMVLDKNVFRAEVEPMLEIRFKLSYRRLARLDVYDVAGYHVTTLTEDIYDGGWNHYQWNGRKASGEKVGSGIYLVTLESGSFKAWKKFIVVR
jgi:uncharacterized repeat protein (TIGR01451 family)